MVRLTGLAEWNRNSVPFSAFGIARGRDPKVVIYARPEGVHHPVARVLAGALLMAMLVLGLLGYPPQAKSQVAEWRDVTGLPALNGTDATGRAAPAPLDVELDGSYPLSVSTTPTLAWRGVPAGAGAQVEFRITTLAEKNPKTIWSRSVAVGTDRTAKAKVPGGVLAQGRTYAWSASSLSAPAVRTALHGVTVDVQRSGSQPVFTAGNLAVTEGTGELVYTYQGPSMSSLAGPIGWTLVHRPTNTPQKGLPNGWRLVVTGTTGWESIRLNDDGSVTLATGTGVSVTYTKRGDNQWEPQIGRYNTAGEATLLTQNADGTFSATDGNRMMTVFSKPTLNANGFPVRVWALDTPAPQVQWEDGRVVSVTDPVTGNPIAFLYSGDEGCTSEVDPGFVRAPMGMLCGTIDATGDVVMLEYVRTPAGVQIGRIVNGLGMGVYAQSSDIGWDDSGRIAEVRDPLAASAMASGKVGGLDEQDPRVLTQVAYDAQGRVASLTAPAGLISGGTQTAQREERPKAVFSYAPFTVRTAGVSTPAGFDRRDFLDPVTLQIQRQIDLSGNVVTTTYDASGSPVRVVDGSSGTVTETRYGKHGKPIEQLGPTKGRLDAPTAPRTTTAYDEDEQGRAWKGLGVKYWDNAGFNGAPVGGSTGPQIGGSTPASLSFNWASSPTGRSGAWAARMNGVFVAPADGAYQFETQTSARLWINGRICAPDCSAALGAGDPASIQVDVAAPAGGTAGVKVMVSGPDGRQVPLPSSQLRPNYGLATSSTVRENTGSGVRDLVTKMVYDPVTTQLLKTISPSGATITRTYEPYNPANGQWGRSTSVTDASGKTTTSAHFGANETAADCSGQQIPQDGQVKSVTLPDGQVVTGTNVPGAGPIKAADGASIACGTVLAGDAGFATTTSGLGASVTQTTLPMVGGDPLANAVTTATGDGASTELTRVDTNGQVWKSVDAHGTTTVRQWDALTGNLTRLVETTAEGQSRTTEYTYTPGGENATVTVNGHLLIRNEYASNGTLLRSVLGNGAVQTFELDQNNNGRRITTAFPDGTTLVESMVHSPSGRLLSRTLAGPSGTSTYTYDYNADGRLVDTTLTGSIPTSETRWQSAYTGPDGANGNRASQTVTAADGTQTTTRFAYGADNRLLNSTDPKVGTIEYDAAGRATRIGGVALSYDSAGHLLSAADGKRAYHFSEAGTTTTLTQTVAGETTTLTATVSGESLVLDADRRIDAQVVSPARGVNVVLDENGVPARWVYDDSLGNGTWSSAGDRAPTKTQLYSPDGSEVGVVRTSTATPVGLMLDAMGWQNGSGVTHLRLSTPISIVGDRSYTPAAGRWLQADPTVGGSMNAYEYAIGDPINVSDSTGNAPVGWIIGSVAAVVTGVLIGTLTFGIGVGGVLGYGYAAFAAQIGLGLVSGAIEGVVAEVVTQLVDGTSWRDLNWASVGISAGIGAGAGALGGAIGGYMAKIKLPGKQLRLMAADSAGTATQASRMKAYDAVWSKHVKSSANHWEGPVSPGRRVNFNNMFTKRSWKTNPARAAAAEAKAGAGLSFDDVLSDKWKWAADGNAGNATKLVSGGGQDFTESLVANQQRRKISNTLTASESSVDIDALLGNIKLNSGKAFRAMDDVRTLQKRSFLGPV